MSKPRIRLYRIVPGANSTAQLLKRFCAEGPGTVTAFDDSYLKALRTSVPEGADIEFVPLGMLVRRCLESSGESAGMLATRPQRLAAIEAALAGVESGSTVIQSMRFPGNREIFAELINELEDWRIDLETAADLPGISEELSEKLADLRSLDRKSRDLLANLQRQSSSEQMVECLDSVLDPEVRLPRLMVLVGDETTPLKVAWIRWLAEQGCSIILVAPRHPQVPEMFQDANSLALELDCTEQAVGAATQLAENLFSETHHPAIPVKATLTIAANPLAECEWVLSSMANEPEGSCAIFVRDTETYEAMLACAANSTGVDLMVYRRVPLLQNGFAKLILELMEACVSADLRLLQRLTLRSYIADPAAHQWIGRLVAPRDPSERGDWRSFTQGDAEGLIEEWLANLAIWRSETIVDSAPLDRWVAKLKEIGGLVLHRSAKVGEGEYDSRRDERAFFAMQSSILTAARLETDTPRRSLHLAAFVQRCRQLWEAADVSVPASDRGIPVCHSVWGIPPVKRLAVLGMLEGKFPGRRRENSILNDEERMQLAAALPVDRPLRRSNEGAVRDREQFYALCATPSERIDFSYPATQDDRDNIPTFYLQRVKAAVGEMATLDRTAAPHPVLAAIEPRPPLLEEGELNLPDLARSRSDAHTPREIQDAFLCPFRYLARHRLRLFSNAKTAAWFRLRVLPSTTRLPKIADLGMAGEVLQAALSDELERLESSLGTWELRLLRVGGERLIGEWLQKEKAAREIWPKSSCNFGERALGGTGVRNEAPYQIALNAEVAGVSFFNDHLKVLHLFESHTPKERELAPDQVLFFGLYLLAGDEPGFQVALEVDGLNGGRSLVMIDQDSFPAFRSLQELKLGKVYLGEQWDVRLDRRPEFFKGVKTNLREAISRIEAGRADPVPGDHCKNCDFGELCRRSREFGDGAPFAESG